MGNNYYDVSDSSASGYKAYTNAAAGLVWSRTSATWEPPDAAKGDIARALLYLTIRYTGDAASEPRLTVADATNLIVAGSTFMGRYSTLLKWHFADPVSAAEQARNDGVYAYQTNRNPFVDNPEWVAVAFIPPLTIALSGTNIALRWTNDYIPTMLAEQSTNLASAWWTVTNQPVVVSDQNVVVQPMSDPHRFYRLSR